MKLLNCVISYDRVHYLRNTVDSLLEYFRFGDTLVIDNGSKDPRIVEYLGELRQRGCFVIRHEPLPETDSTSDARIAIEMAIDPDNRVTRPGLISATKEAVEFAMAHGYDYVQIIHDDMQFMWHDPDFPNKVDRIFRERADIVVLCPLFLRENDYSALLSAQAVPEVEGIRHGSFSMMEVSIFPVSLVREHGFRFMETQENYAYWAQRGRRVYFMHAPVAASIPWVASFRARRLTGPYKAPPRKYYLKPLSTKQIQALQMAPPGVFPYQEAYCYTWGWAALKPYWFFAPDLPDYTLRLLSAWHRKRFLFPLFGVSGWPHYWIPNPFKIYPRLLLQAAKLIARRARAQRPAAVESHEINGTVP